MNNTVLRILQIFENETDNDYALTKMEILDMLEREGFDISEKQFYRKVEELKDNGYDIEIRKGRQTRYFLRRNRLRREEWLYLITILMGNEDLSARETNRIIDCLSGTMTSLRNENVFETFKGKLSPNKNKINNLTNFREIIRAIDNNREITCKQIVDLENLVFSERKQIKPIDYCAKENKINIIVAENGQNKAYFLNELIDVELV